MIQSRIREIRKEKGLTLQDVASRAGTTAQTIGRLETGMRTLSLNWVSRIADALAVDPASLLSLPETGDLEIEGNINSKGNVAPGAEGTLGTRFFANRPMAFRVSGDLGNYRTGDILVFEGDQTSICQGKECLVTLKDGKSFLARVLRGGERGSYSLVLAGDEAKVLENVDVIKTAPLAALVRKLS